MNYTLSNLMLAIVTVVVLLMTVGCSKESSEPTTEEVLKEKVALLQEQLESKKNEISELKKEHEDSIKRIKTTFDTGKEHDQEMLNSQKKQYEEQIASLKVVHKEELDKKVTELNNQIASLKEKNAFLEKSRHIDKETENMIARLPNHYNKMIAIAVFVFFVLTFSLGGVLIVFVFRYYNLKNQLLATLNTNLQEVSHE